MGTADDKYSPTVLMAQLPLLMSEVGQFTDNCRRIPYVLSNEKVQVIPNAAKTSEVFLFFFLFLVIYELKNAN